MAIALNELDALYSDELMIDLCRVTIAKLAGLIVQAEHDTPNSQGPERLEFAEGALANPENGSNQIWRYMVGTNTAATADQISRSVGDPATPADATIEAACQEAINALHPVGT